MGVSRRDFVKQVGAGTALAGLGGITGIAPARANTTRAPIPMPQELEAELQRRMEAALAARNTGTGLRLCEGTDNTDPLAAHTVQVAPNWEPVIPHDGQAAEAQAKLAALAAKTGKRPNILIFLMDNVGYGDIGLFGGGVMAGAPTPNIDRLGREGLQLVSTYSQPSCTPTRCTLLTGRLPKRHGQTRPSFAGEPGGLQNETTVARILSHAGYMTQAVGKWHCGENDASQPQAVGFDDFYGFLGWSGLYTDWQDPEFAPEFALNPERQELVTEVGFNNHIVHGVKGQAVEDLEEITLEVSAQLDDKFAAYSEEFIRRMAGCDKPFFLYHCTRGAHFKNYANPRFRGKSPAKYPYKDCLVEMDDVVGRLVKALEDTGQLENTLVFVTSDNGPLIEPWPDAGWTPFRGGMPSTWEGGQRVPTVVYWKDMIQPGRISDGLFDLSDLFNTSVALAQAQDQIPTNRYIDGIDQTSFLLADNGLSNRKYVWYWLMNTFSGLRVAEYKWMVAGMSADDWDVVNPAAATTLENFGYSKLFNLYLDPGERFSFYTRQTFMDNLFTDPYAAHMQTFKDWPEPTSPESVPAAAR